MNGYAAVFEYLSSPAGAVLVALAAVAFVRFAPPPLVALVRAFCSKVEKVEKVEPQPAAAAELVEDVHADEYDDVGELVAAAQEAAANRYPDMHPAEALDRYTLDIRSENHYHRDQLRKAEAERVKAAAAAAPVTITAADVGELFGRIERHG